MSQHQAESAQALLDALTSQLQSISMQPGSQLNAVSIKLPEFWTTPPEVWFARVEAQFGTKNITQDQTRYDYVVSALDFKTAEEVQDVLVSPPEAEKYTTLKKALIKAFGKSQAQRDSELLNGLGDRKPTALLRKINALNDDPQTLKRALFLSNLPLTYKAFWQAKTSVTSKSLQRLLTVFGKPVVQAYITLHRILVNLPPLLSL